VRHCHRLDLMVVARDDEFVCRPLWAEESRSPWSQLARLR
jgi:hypothetical protein